MRILVVGDQHFRYELPYASAIPDGRRAEWEDVKSTIVTASKTCDAVVLMGDNLNSRHNHSSVIREFVDFLKEFGDKPVHILVGNHERYGMHTALDFLQKLGMPNWHVYTSITQGVQLAPGITGTFIPFTTPAMLGVETKQEAEEALFQILKPASVAFVHHAITGTSGTDFFNEIMLNKDKMSTLFGTTFGGHVHKPEMIQADIQVTGNIFTQEVGEYSKFVFVWTDRNSPGTSIEAIPLPVRGIYKVEMGLGSIFTGPTTVVPEHSIVKCIITDRSIDVEKQREVLKQFDAGVIVEQYQDERTKVHFEGGGLDLSIEGLLKLYADTKGVSYTDVKEGFDLIK